MAEEFTGLLAAWRGGDLAARDRLVALVYPELRAIARRQLANERGDHTLQPTALANEAYMRLSRLDRIDWQDRLHFVRMASRLMREILVDHARRHGAGKRDGGERVPITQVDVAAPVGDIDMLALDGALDRLAAVDPARAQLGIGDADQAVARMLVACAPGAQQRGEIVARRHVPESSNGACTTGAHRHLLGWSSCRDAMRRQGMQR